MSFVSRALLAAAFAAAASGVSPAPALARWPFEVPHAVALPFGARYGEGRTHSGLDLEAAAGERVVAPVKGRVSFVGFVPVGEDARATAVTIETAEGDKVTLLPFADTGCSRGDAVDEGDPLGSLAETGDVSGDAPHLHISLRRGSLYVDPARLMGSSGGTAGASAAPAPATPGQTSAGAAPAAPKAARTAPQARAASPARARSVASPAPAVVPVRQTGVNGVLQVRSAPAAPVSSGVVVPGGAGSPGAIEPYAVDPGARSLSTAHSALAGADAGELALRTVDATRSFATRHARALALGVAALLAGVSAVSVIDRLGATLRESSEDVGPEGESVASTLGRC